MTNDLTRRAFLFRASGSVGAAWVSTHWPAVLAAATHAREAARSETQTKLEFFSTEEAVEIDALTARIIPSDDTPGAREAGAVYFIDHALTAFARDDQKTYKDGLPDLQARVRELFPEVEKFSKASPEQQDQVLHSLDKHAEEGLREFRSSAAAKPFFETLRVHTIIAFLIDPESGGNRNGVGWKVIGRDPDHMFQPPFGYYDKDAGWQPNPQQTDPNTA
jgi:gluconate 2-dehydrogenase gamma chain